MKYRGLTIWLKRDLYLINFKNLKKTTQDEYFSSSIICVEVNEATGQHLFSS